MDKINRKKCAVSSATVFAIVVATILVFATVPRPVIEKEWQVIWKGNLATAEATPGGSTTGFLSIFCRAHVASGTLNTSLANNATDWSADSLAYADADEFSETLVSETSFDIIVRAQFNKTHAWDATQFIDTRCRVKITVTSSDWADGEDISDVAGTVIVSDNNTAYGNIYINFYWNANDNLGYQLADGGTITVAEISIEAEF